MSFPVDRGDMTYRPPHLYLQMSPPAWQILQVIIMMMVMVPHGATGEPRVAQVPAANWSQYAFHTTSDTCGIRSFPPKIPNSGLTNLRFLSASRLAAALMT